MKIIQFYLNNCILIYCTYFNIKKALKMFFSLFNSLKLKVYTLKISSNLFKSKPLCHKDSSYTCIKGRDWIHVSQSIVCLACSNHRAALEFALCSFKYFVVYILSNSHLCQALSVAPVLLYLSPCLNRHVSDVLMPTYLTIIENS